MTSSISMTVQILSQNSLLDCKAVNHRNQLVYLPTMIREELFSCCLPKIAVPAENERTWCGKDAFMNPEDFLFFLAAFSHFSPIDGGYLCGFLVFVFQISFLVNKVVCFCLIII